MSSVSQEITEFWQAFVGTMPMEERPQEFEAWGFGNSSTMADELGALVRGGIKTATCSLLWEHEADGDPLPQVGGHSVVLNGADKPLCVIETAEVSIRPFRDVDAQFAFEEGEGDRSLESWRRGHWEFFDAICTRLGRSVTEDMPLVCERFRLVYRG